MLPRSEDRSILRQPDGLCFCQLDNSHRGNVRFTRSGDQQQRSLSSHTPWLESVASSRKQSSAIAAASRCNERCCCTKRCKLRRTAAIGHVRKVKKRLKRDGKKGEVFSLEISRAVRYAAAATNRIKLALRGGRDVAKPCQTPATSRSSARPGFFAAPTASAVSPGRAPRRSAAALSPRRAPPRLWART